MSQMRISSERLSQLIIAAAGMLMVVHHFGFYYGHYGYDDMHYACMSHDLLSGHIDWSDHYSYRWGVLVSTAISYAIFGVTDWASALPSLLASFVIFGIFYTTFRRYPYVLMIVIALYLSSGWTLFYSDKIMPDIHVAAYGLLAWWSYDRYRLERWQWSFVICALALFAAFCTKGTIILLLPIFIFSFIHDRGWLAHMRPLWSRVLGLIGVLLAVYLFWCYWASGSALGRLDAIGAGSYPNSCSYDQMPISATIQRLTHDFLDFAWSEMFWVPIVVMVGVLLMMKRRRKKIDWYYPLTITMCLLTANLMTISLDSYNPTCLDPRHFLLFWPIWAICIGRMVIQIGWMTPGIRYAIVAVSLLLMIKPINQMIDNRNTEYPSLRSEIKTALKDPSLKDYHLTGNDVMSNLLDYYGRYQQDEIVRSDTLYLRSWYTDWHGEKTNEEIPDTSADDAWARRYQKLQFYRR